MIWTIQEEVEAEWGNWRQARGVDGSGTTTGNGRDRDLDGHPTTLFQITVQEGKEEVSNYRPIESSSRSD